MKDTFWVVQPDFKAQLINFSNKTNEMLDTKKTGFIWKLYEGKIARPL